MNKHVEVTHKLEDSYFYIDKVYDRLQDLIEDLEKGLTIDVAIILLHLKKCIENLEEC